METLRTNFPNRLNERLKNLISGTPIGTNFNTIGRSG